MNDKEALLVILRYFVLLLLPLGSFFIYLVIFTPLTVYPVLSILKILSPDAHLVGWSLLFFRKTTIEIISACIAAPAYYLLTVLNLITPIKAGKRALNLLFLLGCFLFINIARIVLFSMLAATKFSYFDLAHNLTWHLGSTVLLVLIWFVGVWVFEIKEIPGYTDLKNIYADTKLKHMSKH